MSNQSSKEEVSFSVEELVTIVRHEAYTDREKRLARQCLRLVEERRRDYEAKRLGVETAAGRAGNK